MSWLSEVFSGDSPQTIQRPDPQQVQNYYDLMEQNNPTLYEQVGQYDDPGRARKLAAKAAATAGQQTTTAQATNVIPAYSGPTAEAKLQALLPQGFESTLVPSSVADPYITSTIGKARSTAQDFIENMFKRGTVTGSGRTSGLSALTAQDPSVKSKLAGISNALIEGERAKLRGIANEGYGAASGQSGETFDPNPYYGRTNTEAAQFLSAFPTSYTTAVGDTGGLYDTSGLAGKSGAAVDTRNVSFDPYAVEGGKLSTGLDESGVPPPAKKRSTAVF